MKCIRILGHKWIHMDSDQISCIPGFLCLEIIGYTDSFNFEKKIYSYSSFFNVFIFGGQKIKSIRIRGDIDISQNFATIFFA